MIMSELESKEGCVVAIIEILGAYLHTYVEKNSKQIIILLFKGKLAEILVMVDPKLYQKYVTYDRKGNAVLYMEINKALCSLSQSAFLFYNKFRKDLEA